MPGHGGKRPGAGRKPSALTRKTREIAEKQVENGITPLEYMLGVMRDETADAGARFEAAKAAAPYVHPRLATVAHTGNDGGPVQVVDPIALAKLSKEERDALRGIARKVAE